VGVSVGDGVVGVSVGAVVGVSVGWAVAVGVGTVVKVSVGGRRVKVAVGGTGVLVFSAGFSVGAGDLVRVGVRVRYKVGDGVNVPSEKTVSLAVGETSGVSVAVSSWAGASAVS
jgi:trehalose/maltose hydrolase-like predicted phosphorylase